MHATPTVPQGIPMPVVLFVSFVMLVASCGGTTEPTIEPPNAPAARWFTSAVYDAGRQQVLLVGGSAGPEFFSDIWAWNGNAWSLVTLDGPSPRDGALVGYDAGRQRVIVHGGRSPDVVGGANVRLTDTWEGQGTTFTRVATTGPQPPRAHFGGGFDAARGRLVLFGGGDPGTILRDTWEWSGQAWEQRASTTPTPLGAPSFGAFSTTRNALLMVAGTFDTGPSEIWQWSGSAWTKAGDGPTASMPLGVVATGPDDLLMFNGDNGETYRWTGAQGSVRVATTGPGQRFGAAMAHDPSRQVVVLFGGMRDGQHLADTWHWNGTSWSQIR